MKSTFVSVAAACLLAGCASTTIQTSGSPLDRPLCAPADAASSVRVLWAPQWRPDQKEPASREAAAQRGIEQYFKALPCADRLAILRVQLPRAHEQLTQADVLALAQAAGGPAPGKVILIVVRELGPRLVVGLPSVVEGGTEVVLEARVVETGTPGPAMNLRTHWRKGGPFYIKGVETLDEDMRAALGEAFSATPGRRG